MHMLYRIVGAHLTPLLITFSVLIGAAGIMTEQISFLIDPYGANFIPAEAELEGNIAILVAAFGLRVYGDVRAS